MSDFQHFPTDLDTKFLSQPEGLKAFPLHTGVQFDHRSEAVEDARIASIKMPSRAWLVRRIGDVQVMERFVRGVSTTT